MTLALAAALCGSARAQAPLPPEVADALHRAQVPESALALLIEPVSVPQTMPASGEAATPAPAHNPQRLASNVRWLRCKWMRHMAKDGEQPGGVAVAATECSNRSAPSPPPADMPWFAPG